jgi:uncharacterized protein YdhG (YjbR/CyaY superfamily)
MKAKQANNIDEYIAGFPDDVQKSMQKVRAAIKKAAPRAEEAISYQIPTFKLNGNLIHFAGYKNHIGLYPGSGAIEEFEDELTGYKLSKGTVQFPLDKPMPVGLINRITKFCVQRNLSKSQKRTKANKS